MIPVWSAVLMVAALAQAPSSAPPHAPPPVDVTGATVIEYDAATQQYTFRGPRVTIVKEAQRLEAPLVVYNVAARRALLPEGGRVSSPTMDMEADQMTADLGSHSALAEGHVMGRFLDGGVWTTISAGRIEAHDSPDAGRAEATSDVVVIREDQQLRGDRLTYDRNTQHGEVEGHAEMIWATDHLRADRVVADLVAREAEATGHVVLERPSEGMRGTADQANYSERTHTAVLSGHVVLRRARDILEAEQITMHLDRHVLEAQGRPRLVAFPEQQP
jgi:lipopolysaccharide transport protein LptA